MLTIIKITSRVFDYLLKNRDPFVTNEEISQRFQTAIQYLKDDTTFEKSNNNAYYKIMSTIRTLQLVCRRSHLVSSPMSMVIKSTGMACGLCYQFENKYLSTPIMTNAGRGTLLVQVLLRAFAPVQPISYSIRIFEHSDWLNSKNRERKKITLHRHVQLSRIFLYEFFFCIQQTVCENHELSGTLSTVNRNKRQILRVSKSIWKKRSRLLNTSGNRVSEWSRATYSVNVAVNRKIPIFRSIFRKIGRKIGIFLFLAKIVYRWEGQNELFPYFFLEQEIRYTGANALTKIRNLIRRE